MSIGNVKPKVLYRPTKNDIIKRGQRAVLLGGTLNHYSPFASNSGCAVYTSPVVKITKTGFETQNTLYERKQ